MGLDIHAHRAIICRMLARALGSIGVAAGAVLACLASTPVADARQAPPLVSGLDLAGFDRSVRPQDDLFRFANGGWLAQTSVPDERVAYGVFQELAERTEQDLRTIIEGVIASGPHRRGSIEQKIADLYLSMSDVERVDAVGAEPLRPELGRIADLKTKSEFAAEIGRLSALGFGGPFAATLATHGRDAGRLVVQIEQGGTLLPNRDYYLKDAPAFTSIRHAYREYLTTIFELAGLPGPAEAASVVVALETDIARILWSEAKSREGSLAARPFTLGDLTKTMPGFDWRAWAKPQGIERADAIDLGQPSFFTNFATLVEKTPLESWKAWLSARYITAAAPYVSQPFELARFDLFGRKLTGQPEPRARWRRSVGIVHQYLGDALGRLYVRKHFPPKSRAKVSRLVSHLVDAFNEAIRHAAWMSGGARGAALDKLANLTTKIGYPDEWAAYDGLEIRADDLLGNAQRAVAHQHTLRLSRVHDPAARRRWFITPLAINAYYNPALNEIVLPAAILQPPLFNPDADPAVNYGAIGGIIGHELTHAFDAQGRSYDASGEVRNWWQPVDERAFMERLQRMALQFSAYRPLPDVPLDGTLTAAENLADLAGLSIALAAYRRSLDGKPSPVLDGFTGEQRVFLGWAQAWRGVLRESYLRQWLLITPHAPPEFRANGPLGNLDAFIEAFGVKPGDRLYRAPERRVRVW